MDKLNEWIEPIKAMHARIRDAVVAACEATAMDQLADADTDQEGDIIYAIDRVSEEHLLELLADFPPLVLIAEGLPNAGCVLPAGTDEASVAWRMIVDPIDGTRGLMYQKRSAWILTGLAPNRGPSTSLKDIQLAVQTEIPLIKQHLSDCVWWAEGETVGAERHNRISGETHPLHLQPSTADHLEHGFVSFSRFFPGMGSEAMARVEQAFGDRLIPPSTDGKALTFEDQYISNAGQLYELMAGHDRFIADIRPLVHGENAPSARPYDLCTEKIARALGCPVTDPAGQPLDVPLDVLSPVSWVGYANPALQSLAEPVLQDVLNAHGFLR
ncbi:MAG: hypothetical protein ACI9TH_003968 [Kiritimatiellia bacterium]|jgi:hypothetical protein